MAVEVEQEVADQHAGRGCRTARSDRHDQQGVVAVFNLSLWHVRQYLSRRARSGAVLGAAAAAGFTVWPAACSRPVGGPAAAATRIPATLEAMSNLDMRTTSPVKCQKRASATSLPAGLDAEAHIEYAPFPGTPIDTVNGHS